MSRLEDIGRQLDAVAKDANQWAAALSVQARELKLRAQILMRAAQQSNYAGKQAIAQLQYAAKKVEAAAALLNNAELKSRAWITASLLSCGGSDGSARHDSVGNGSGMLTEQSGGFTKHLSPEEVNARWQSGVESIDEHIANYHAALLARGVPEGKWLNQTLAQHRARMLEQEGYNLDLASGHTEDSTNAFNAYQYPGDYPAFYDQLADDFRRHCLSGANPNYESGPAWQNNCQRCVPTYELRRRGAEVTARPSTYGSDHLSHHPFDVWEKANVISCQGSGLNDIQNTLSSWGDGARAQLVVVWNDGFGTNGHTFIAEQRNGTTHFFDPQNGEMDAVSYFDDVMVGETQFCRIDNLRTSNYINECYTEEASS